MGALQTLLAERRLVAARSQLVATRDSGKRVYGLAEQLARVERDLEAARAKVALADEAVEAGRLGVAEGLLAEAEGLAADLPRRWRPRGICSTAGRRRSGTWRRRAWR